MGSHGFAGWRHPLRYHVWKTLNGMKPGLGASLHCRQYLGSEYPYAGKLNSLKLTFHILFGVPRKTECPF